MTFTATEISLINKKGPSQNKVCLNALLFISLYMTNKNFKDALLQDYTPDLCLWTN